MSRDRWNQIGARVVFVVCATAVCYVFWRSVSECWRIAADVWRDAEGRGVIVGTVITEACIVAAFLLASVAARRVRQ